MRERISNVPMGQKIADDVTKTCQHCHHKAITAEELHRLAALPPSVLESALMQSYAAAGFIDDALMTDDEKDSAARAKLYRTGMSAAEVHKMVPALDKWYDRTMGKAPQSIAMTVKADPASSLSDDQLAALLALLPEPMIIPPLPKRLEDQ